MKHLTVLVACLVLAAILGSSAYADIVVRPQWSAEQTDGGVHWYYYWHGQKYHVDPAGQHWIILPTLCAPSDNRFPPCAGGPVRQTLVSVHGRLSNLAERACSR